MRRLLLIRSVPTDAEVARYAAEMCEELRRMTKGRPALHALAYVLDMARLEGERQATAGRTTSPR